MLSRFLSVFPKINVGPDALSSINVGEPAAVPGVLEDESGDLDEAIVEENESHPNKLLNGREAVLSDFKDIELLAAGSFGRVFLVKDKKQANKYYAMKTIRKSDTVRLNQVDHVRNEREIMMTVDSPFITKLYCTFQSSTRLFFLMEYVPGGDLFFLLRRTKRFPDRVAKFYTVEVALALFALHRLHIVYRDVKPENILIDSYGHVKLTDFGFAKRLGGAGGKTWTLAATAEYAAPELICREGQTCAVDYWSLGVLLYEMLAGKVPFYGMNPFETYSLILNGHLSFPPFVRSEAKNLIKGLLTKNPAARLGGGGDAAGRRSLKAHGWFSGVNWDMALRKQDMRVPWVPTLAHAGDSIQFRRANQADRQLAQQTALPSALQCVPDQSPSAVPMHSPLSKYHRFAALSPASSARSAGSRNTTGRRTPERRHTQQRSHHNNQTSNVENLLPSPSKSSSSSMSSTLGRNNNSPLRPKYSLQQQHAINNFFQDF